MSFIDIVVRLIFLVVFVILEVIAVSTVFQLIFCIPGIKLLNQKGEKVCSCRHYMKVIDPVAR